MRIVDAFRARMEANLAEKGFTLPWWFPCMMTGASVVSTLVAVGQRGSPLPSWPVVAGGLIALVPLLAWIARGEMMPPWFEALTVLTSVSILLTHQATPDFAPVLLVILTGETVAISGPLLTVLVTVASIAVLGIAELFGGLAGSVVYMLGVLLGLSVGVMVRWYMRALDAERANQDSAREQAVLAERQHIAREVHDVVAHSLTITLLHLTGARHALQQDHDVDDAVEALIEAERVGRAAMADIRKTVSLLARAPSGTQPLPGIDDICGLIERTRAAGLDVRYQQRGDMASVGASEGLGLYRIAQESLANIAKHAPSATARVDLLAGPAGMRLTVSNDLPTDAAPPGDTGAGLTGMSSRARLLGASFRAGPRGQEWVVDVMVPAATVRSGCKLGLVTP